MRQKAEVVNDTYKKTQAPVHLCACAVARRPNTVGPEIGLSCSSREGPKLLSLHPEVLSPSPEVRIHQEAQPAALIHQEAQPAAFLTYYMEL